MWLIHRPKKKQETAVEWMQSMHYWLTTEMLVRGQRDQRLRNWGREDPKPQAVQIEISRSWWSSDKKGKDTKIKQWLVRCHVPNITYHYFLYIHFYRAFYINNLNKEYTFLKTKKSLTKLFNKITNMLNLIPDSVHHKCTPWAIREIFFFFRKIVYVLLLGCQLYN